MADYVVVAAPHTPETVGMFACDNLAMKSDAILINIGRAHWFADDLVTSLRQGEIGGAALDVYEIEPLPSRTYQGTSSSVISRVPCIAERHLGVVLKCSSGAPLQNLVNKPLVLIDSS